MRRGSAELAAFNAGLALVVVVGVASALWPAGEVALNTVSVVALAAAALVLAGRRLARLIRERAEDRADARYAAAVRASAESRRDPIR